MSEIPQGETGRRKGERGFPNTGDADGGNLAHRSGQLGHASSPRRNALLIVHVDSHLVIDLITAVAPIIAAFISRRQDGDDGKDPK